MEPEQRLWFAVIEKAVEDARGEYVRGEGKARNAMHEARRWLMDGNDDFRTVCEYAGVSPDHVHKMIRKTLPSMTPQRRKNGVVMNAIFATRVSVHLSSACV